jgi:hypothetical protein
VTWYATESDRTNEFPRILEGILRSLARLGIDAEHAHLTPQIVPSTHLAQTYYRPVTGGNVLRVGSRIEFDLIQPEINRTVRRASVDNEEGVPGARLNPPLGGLGSRIEVPGREDKLHCPVDHLSTTPATEIYAIWSRAWSGPARRGSGSVHAELITSRRCPACLSEVLTEAPKMRAPNGQERATGRCPCCNACWLTDEPYGWACLDVGRLSMGPHRTD